MNTSSSWLRRLVFGTFAVAFLGNVAQAQQRENVVAPQNFRPGDMDAGYAARKARQITQVAVSPVSGPQLQRTSGANDLPTCFEPLDQATYTAVPRDDDNYIGPIQLGFNFTLFGTTYTSCYINTNGNISFNQGVSVYNPQGFPYNVPMVAPFWGDVDARAAGSGRVWYKVYADRLVVTWDQVSYYTEPAMITPLKNTFQVVLRANTGSIGADNVGFAYGDMQWTTGNASNGSAGFRGTPSTVGINQGLGLGNYIGTGRFNLNDTTPPLSAYPVGTTAYSGVQWLDNRCIGYVVAPAGNLPPTAVGFPAGNALTLNEGQTVSLPLQFSGPESGQTVSVVPNLGGLCNATAPTPAVGLNPLVNFTITGAACNLSTHTVSFVATDNGVPARTQTFTLNVTVLPQLLEWTGLVSKAYNLPGNWLAGVVPTANHCVRIPAGAPNDPLLTSAAEITNLTVASGASMTVGTGGDLSVLGTLVNNGVFQGSAGTVRATGTSPQTFGGSAALLMGVLNVGSAGVTLSAGLDVNKQLTLNGNLTTNGLPLRLLSDANGTAMVVNNGSAVVLGDATVQRYIDPSLNAGLGYRHLAAPVAGATLMALATPGHTPMTNPAYNTQGTSVSPFPTVFGYDESRVTGSGSVGAQDFDQGFFSPSATTDAFGALRGYTSNMPANSATGSSAPVSFTGPLHNGAFSSGPLSRGSQALSGWHLLGNPYPAPLDWDAAMAGATGLENAVYVFKSSGPYAGSYDSYVNGVGTARYISVAQGFFVRAATNGARLDLTNAARVGSYLNPAFNRVAPAATGDQRPQLRLDLVGGDRTDAAYVYFQTGATAGYDARFDARKLAGGSPLYLATGTGSPAYSINGLPALTATGAAVPLMTYVPQAGSFVLQVGELKNFGTATLHLEDRETGHWHDLRQQPSFTFRASRADAAASRFVLHVDQRQLVGSSPLAAKATTLAASALSVWPNPASGVLHCTVTTLPAAADDLQMVLLNMLGQVAARQVVPVRGGTATATFDVSRLAPGVYTLKGSSHAHTFARSVVVH